MDGVGGVGSAAAGWAAAAAQTAFPLSPTAWATGQDRGVATRLGERAVVAAGQLARLATREAAAVVAVAVVVGEGVAAAAGAAGDEMAAGVGTCR